jgi:hypothetical protein
MGEQAGWPQKIPHQVSSSFYVFPAIIAISMLSIRIRERGLAEVFSGKGVRKARQPIFAPSPKIQRPLSEKNLLPPPNVRTLAQKGRFSNVLRPLNLRNGFAQVGSFRRCSCPYGPWRGGVCQGHRNINVR